MTHELPAVCASCCEWIDYTEDIDGIWASCPCDCGYVVLK